MPSVPSLVRGRIEWLKTPAGRSMIKYTAVSAISTLVSQGILYLTFTVGNIASATYCAAIANAVATIPAYNLNRRWAWGKKGKSHLWREVVPFWTFSIAGFFLSTGLVYFSRRLTVHFGFSHGEASAVVQAANLFGYGVLWIGKFLVFNRLFRVIADHEVGEESVEELVEV